MQKLGFLPEANNDMIFSVICEELGLFGALCVLALFFALLWRFMVIAINAPDLYGSMLVIGVIAHIGIQVFIILLLRQIQCQIQEFLFHLLVMVEVHWSFFY